ncbi:hypothetical protein HDU76_012963 [Blyttiomyces sp. JEL0837]|nr:hypothetical protein HDU76_012963 [Blyttiomyces sp. JEL0837]
MLPIMLLLLPLLPAVALSQLVQHPVGQTLNLHRRNIITIRHGQPVQKLPHFADITQPNLIYYGGPVIANVEIYPIFYGDAGFKNEIIKFYKAIANSTYMNLLTEFATPNTIIGKGKYVGSFQETNLGTSRKLDDVADIIPYIRSLIKAGTLKPTVNTYFPIHFQSGFSITQSGSGSCVDFCGYHGTIDISDITKVQYAYYGVIPDQSGSCFGGCGGSTSVFDNVCSVASHELIEAITNPAVGLAQSLASPLAWYQSSGGEIGDLCNAQEAKILGSDGQVYTAQLQWSNKYKKCMVPQESRANATTASTGCHDPCVWGLPMTADCGACAASVINRDSYRGATNWDSACIDEAIDICKISCPTATKKITSATVNKGTATNPPNATPPTNCHSLCVEGPPMDDACDPCVAKINGNDPSCTYTWDATCISEVGIFCDTRCSSVKITTIATITTSVAKTTTSTLAKPTTTVACPHGICQSGVKLPFGSCGKCADKIIVHDSNCGDKGWDDTCVGYVQSVCKLSCSGSTTTTLKISTTTSANYLFTTPSIDSTMVGTTSLILPSPVACPHNICTSGVKLPFGSCGDCADTILQRDSYCLDVSWDDGCVGYVKTVCNVNCQEVASSAAAASEPASVAFTTKTTQYNVACPHSICVSGPKLPFGSCGSCADKIIQHDSYCGENMWDDTCVGYVLKVCQLDCSQSTAPIATLNVFSTLKTIGNTPTKYPSPKQSATSTRKTSSTPPNKTTAKSVSYLNSSTKTASTSHRPVISTERMITTIRKTTSTSKLASITAKTTTIKKMTTTAKSQNTCPHSPCQTGVALPKGLCGSCADQIMNYNNYCGTKAWNSVCVGSVSLLTSNHRKAFYHRDIVNIKHGQPVQSLPKFAATTQPNLVYYGGPVIANVEVYPIFYGNVNFKNELNGFYKAIVNSTYMNILMEYTTPTTAIGNGTLIGSYQETNPNTKTSLDDDADIMPYISLAWISADIMVYMKAKLFFLAASPNRRLIPTGTIDISDITKVQYAYYVSSHELLEAITDPAVGLASSYAAPLAWYQPVGGEISDLCNAQEANVLGSDNVVYTVQLQWSNKYKKCMVPPESVANRTVALTGCHDPCVVGLPMTKDCGTCAATVVGNDAYCGSTTWDKTCVSEAVTWCKISCTAPTTTAAANIGYLPQLSTTTTTTTKTTTTKSPVPTPTNCRSVCAEGAPMDNNCNTCVALITKNDPFCLQWWDATCVSEVALYCRTSCSATTTTTKKSTTATTTTKATSTVACPHSPCTSGVKLQFGSCGTCADTILQYDSYCGNTSWDDTCVGYVRSVCQLTCSTTTTTTSRKSTSTSSSRRSTTTSRKSTTTSKKLTTTSRKSTITSKKLTTTSRKSTTTSKKLTTTSHKMTTTTRRITTSSKKFTTTSPRATTTTRKTTTSMSRLAQHKLHRKDVTNIRHGQPLQKIPNFAAATQPNLVYYVSALVIPIKRIDSILNSNWLLNDRDKGGPVIANVEIYPIYYGNANFKNELNAFYKAIANSTYMNLLAEYATPSTVIGTGTFVGSYQETNPNSKTSLDDDGDIIPYIRSLITKGTIKPTKNTYFPIHFQTGYNIVQGTTKSCVDFCGYHGTIDISDITKVQYAYYGIIPDQSGDCFGGCGSSPSVFDNLCSVSSHELLEAITDPAVGIASSYASPLAWYQPVGGEISDLCNAQEADVLGTDGVVYTVQLQWSNKYKKCMVPPESKANRTVALTGCHDPCIMGLPMTKDCGTCAATVVGNDAYCGSTAWDKTCIAEAVTWCKITCTTATTAAAPAYLPQFSTTTTTTTTTTKSTSAKAATATPTNCHSVCVQGPAMDSAQPPKKPPPPQQRPRSQSALSHVHTVHVNRV